MRQTAVLVLLIILSACTTVRVNKVDLGGRPLGLVCIENNPKVIVDDFVPIVESGFKRHGISTVLQQPPVPATCEVVLTYTARRGWDGVPYLKYAELQLSEGGRVIGSATYRHGGGFGLNKWASTQSKMTPVIDALLIDY